MAKSLMDKAKAYQPATTRREEYTLQEEELCMAWLNGDIGLQAVQYALGLRASGQVYVFLARCSRQLFSKSKPKSKK